MESPPDLETVYQAVYSLYNNSNPSGPGKTSQWLDELQKSVSYLLAAFLQLPCILVSDMRYASLHLYCINFTVIDNLSIISSENCN